MKRDKDNQTLTRVEMEIMNRLWAKDKPSASVRELLTEYPDPKPAYTTLGTYMKILTEKGFVKPEKREDDGKTFFFRPLITQNEYRKIVMKDVKNTLFGGSMRSLVNFFAKEEKIPDDEIQELLSLIKE
jgi:predicted transcriptional regulator